MPSIAILIPTTSNKTNTCNILETYLCKTFLQSFVKIIGTTHRFKLFLGFDSGDVLFDNDTTRQFLINHISPYAIDVEFCTMNIKKGHLSKMWNTLYKLAYDEGFEYFYQCGDDIDFMENTTMFDSCIDSLSYINNIGVTGPYTSNTKLLTQTFVSRKHMEIFGFYFPEEIENWYIDDWINLVYGPELCIPIKTCSIKNCSSTERYSIINLGKDKLDTIIAQYKNKIHTYKTIQS